MRMAERVGFESQSAHDRTMDFEFSDSHVRRLAKFLPRFLVHFGSVPNP
jgi:hypothetical protein